MQREEPEHVLRNHLESDEKLLWTGRPLQGVRLRPQDAFLIPFSLLWGGFAIFWEFIVLMSFFGAWGEAEGPTSTVLIMFSLFGLPFVLMGVYMIVGRFFVDARQRAHKFYGVTDNRIIIVSGLFSRKVKSLNMRTLSDLSMKEGKNGAGTITFGPTHPMAALFAGTSWPGGSMYSAPAFDSIPNVAEAYKIIRDAQKAQ